LWSRSALLCLLLGCGYAPARGGPARGLRVAAVKNDTAQAEAGGIFAAELGRELAARGRLEGVARGAVTVSRGDGGGRRELFDATTLAASARRTIGVDRDVTECAGCAIRPGPEPAVDDEPTPDTGAEREASETFRAAASACAEFPPRGAIRIVLERHGNPEMVAQSSRELDVDPAGEVVCADEMLATDVELSGCADAARVDAAQVFDELPCRDRHASDRIIGPSFGVGVDGSAADDPTAVIAEAELRAGAAEVDSEEHVRRRETGDGRKSGTKTGEPAQDVIPSGASVSERRRGIAIIPVEGSAPLSGTLRFLASGAARLRSE